MKIINKNKFRKFKIFLKKDKIAKLRPLDTFKNR